MVYRLTNPLRTADVFALAVVVQDFQPLIIQPRGYLVGLGIVGWSSHLLFFGQVFTSLIYDLKIILALKRSKVKKKSLCAEKIAHRDFSVEF